MTTKLNNEKSKKPAISIAQSDYDRLNLLAEAIAERDAAVSEELFAELDRAKVVADDKFPPNAIRIGSSFRFATDADDSRPATLVLPAEADISKGKISVLTPIGAALIGLSAQQSIDWATRDGRTRRLTVESVDPYVDPSADGADRRA